MRRSILLLLPALALAGCGRHGASRHADVSHDALNAGGEPQWSAQVRGDRLSFADGGELSATAAVTRSEQGKDGVSWTGQPAPAAKGAAPAPPLRLSVVRKACRDPDTGMAYPFTAEAQAFGHRYSGCAAPPGQGLGPRQ